MLSPTTRRRSDFAARSRHPTQVRTGDGRLIRNKSTAPSLVVAPGRSQLLGAVAPLAAGDGASSERMSIRHPVMRAAKRAF